MHIHRPSRLERVASMISYRDGGDMISYRNRNDIIPRKGLSYLYQYRQSSTSDELSFSSENLQLSYPLPSPPSLVIVWHESSSTISIVKQTVSFIAFLRTFPSFVRGQRLRGGRRSISPRIWSNGKLMRRFS